MSHNEITLNIYYIERKTYIQLLTHALICSAHDIDNRPYWFDLPEVLTDIWNDVLKVKDATINIIKWIRSDKLENKKALAYTGKSLVCFQIVKMYYLVI